MLFTKENIDEDKPIPVGNLPPLRFVGGPTNQEIKSTCRYTET